MIERNISLKEYNTFGVEARAGQMLEITSCKQLQEMLPWQAGPLFVLGGGSNILLTGDIGGLVLRNRIAGMEVAGTGERHVLVGAGSGENWHAFVCWCLDQGFGGIENLSLIPGTVGAAPIQNIGAYGVELQDVFERLEAVDLADGRLHVFDRETCKFGYRDSIFKREWKGRFFITKVFLRLTVAPFHRIDTGYGALRSTLEEMGVADPSPRQVSDAVIRIRSEKLPDPAVLGNAGSFFKNPVISEARSEDLKRDFPDIILYPAGDGMVKVPAGWLIERCGWKGIRRGDAGCYEKQALVLVNYGNATGKQIEELAGLIVASVEKTFGITLEKEVNVL